MVVQLRIIIINNAGALLCENIGALPHENAGALLREDAGALLREDAGAGYLANPCDDDEVHEGVKTGVDAGAEVLIQGRARVEYQKSARV